MRADLEGNRDFAPEVFRGLEGLVNKGGAQPGFELLKSTHAGRHLRHPLWIREHGGVGEAVLLLLFRPGLVFGDDPHEHVLAGRLGGLHFAPGDAALALLRHKAIAVGHDAHQHIGLAGLPLALGHRFTRQRPKTLHRHAGLRQPQNRVVGHLPVGHQVLGGGGEEDLHGGHGRGAAGVDEAPWGWSEAQRAGRGARRLDSESAGFHDI